MPRTIELQHEKLILKEDKVEGFLERVVNPIGTSAKVDVPKKHMGKRAYVIILKD